MDPSTAWYLRESTFLDQFLFERQVYLYSLLKRWNDIAQEDAPLTAFIKNHRLEIALQTPQLSIKKLLVAETSRDFIRETSIYLKNSLSLWSSFFNPTSKSNASHRSRILRLTEEDAHLYASQQLSYKNLPQVATLFAAYRETPFFMLYRDSILTLKKVSHEVLFLTPHPIPEVEKAWMRGFITYLKPETEIEQSIKNDSNQYRWFT